VEYLELSLENIRNYSRQIAKSVESWGKPDLVIFIASGGYLIGNELACYFQTPLLKISATRKVHLFKKILSPFLKLLHSKIKMVLRKWEAQSNYHDRYKERDISFNSDIWLKYKDSKKILVVDDSVDTGNTMRAVKETVSSFFINTEKEIKYLAFNYFSMCSPETKPDFYLWVDTMLNAPWSSDSKENRIFLEEYQKYVEPEGISCAEFGVDEFRRI
jgi:hypoxanthine phosphoribosyltransferase